MSFLEMWNTFVMFWRTNTPTNHSFKKHRSRISKWDKII